MSNYGANMPPSLTAGAYSGNGMPPYGMQAATEHYPNANIKHAPMYTSPMSYSPYPMGGYGPMHHGMHHMYHGHVKAVPVYAAAGAYSAGMILVLYILLVIILRSLI
jgi:hypothetical protein